jgi:nicotinamide-nucleotide adenylyltransferase
VDKDRIEGALLEDRLLVLERHVAERPERAAALINRGLYVEQAELFRLRLPRLDDLTFVVGFDKIVQVFDPHYYEDRDAALTRIFGLAAFAVAPRAGSGLAELTELLARPENRRFASGVRSLEIAPGLADVASSEVRSSLGTHQPSTPILPAESLAFIHATGCYDDPAGYLRQRESLIDR